MMIIRNLFHALFILFAVSTITLARAKGIREFWVVIKHALKNAAIPVVTLIWLQLGTMLGGTISIGDIGD